MSDDELAGEQGELLPDREALSVIGTQTGLVPTYDEGAALADTSAVGSADTGTGTGASASDTANSTAGLAATDADASGTESEPDVTSEDRSETFSNTDTAYAGPS